MRNLSTSITDAVEAQGSYPIDFVEIYANPNDRFDDDSSIRLSNGFRNFNISIDGEPREFNPAYQLLSISQLDEVADVKTNSIDIEIAGMDTVVVQAVAGQDVTGSIVILYRGYFNSSTGTLITPYIRWKGVVNSYAYRENNSQDGSVVFQISCKNIVAALLESTGGRFTSLSSFQQHNSDDKSMEFVESLADWNPRFGAD